MQPTNKKAVGNKFPVQSIVTVNQIEQEEIETTNPDPIEALKQAVKDEVDNEDKEQLGLFDGGKEPDQ